MPLKIVADDNIAFATDFFAPLGGVRLLPGRELSAADVQDADVLLVRSITRVNAALLAGSAVKFVGSCTIGSDHVDTDWLAEQGITYACAPGCNAQAVVDYVCAVLEALAVPAHQRVGVVGCGNVGGALLQHLREAGRPCCGYDPLLIDSDLPLVSFEQILACDVICLHTPLTRSGAFPTWHLFDATVIAQIKAGTVLLNAGRGAVIDSAALLQRLHTRNDLRVVLDVWENEPNINTELLARVAIGTPHIAGYSFEGKLRGTQMVYEALCRFLACEAKAPSVGAAAPSQRKKYDPRTDDARLRAAFACEGATAFDRLRKDYLPRL